MLDTRSSSYLPDYTTICAAQTQARLDDAFLGYKTYAFGEEDRTPTGVWEYDTDPAIRPNYATNRSEKGDFQHSGRAKFRHHA